MMRKLISNGHLFVLYILINVVAIVSCNKEELSQVIADENKENVNLSLENMIMVNNGDNFTIDNNKLTVPLTINLSGSAPKAFTIQTFANIDTIAELVSKGTLSTNAVAIETGEFTLPPVIDVAYGVKSVTFNIDISRTFLERNYGKDVVLPVKMISPTKGNSVNPANSTAIIVIQTAAAIAPDAVHYLEFKAAGNQYLVPDGVNYTLGSQDMTIPLELFLTGTPEPEFTVDVVANQDTLNTLIANGTLQNTVSLDPAGFGVVNPKIKFEAAKNTATVNLTARIPILFALTGKKAAIALTLKNPTKHQLSQSKKTIVVVIDPDYFRPYNGTPHTISGTIGQPSTIYAAFYDLGGEGIAFHDDGGRDGGDFRRPDNVDIGGDAPSYVVGWTNNNEWLTYTVIVEADGEYELNAIIGAPDNDGRYSMFFGNDNVTGILASKQTPGAYGDQQPNISTVQLKQGKQVMKFFMDVGKYDVKGYTFTRIK